MFLSISSKNNIYQNKQILAYLVNEYTSLIINPSGDPCMLLYSYDIKLRKGFKMTM